MSIFFESGLDSADFSRALILHANNWLEGGTVTASTTDSDYFEDGPTTSLTYDRWKPTALSATWEYDHGSAAACDVCCIGAHTMGTNGNSLTVEYHNGTSWVSIISGEAIADDSAIMVVFASKTRQRWRISVSGGTVPEVGVVKFGTALEMARPIYGGHTPLALARQTTMRSNKSETGEYLGKTKQRTMLSTEFSWTNLPAAWVRTNIPPFQKAVENGLFFLAWRPSSFEEVGLCDAEATPIPTHSGPRDLMSLSLSVTGYSHD